MTTSPQATAPIVDPPPPIVPPVPPPAQSPLIEATPPAPIPIVAPAPVVATPVVTVELDDDDRANGVTTTADGAVVPSQAFKRLKENAAKKGAQQAEQAIVKRLAKYGVTSIDDLIKQLEEDPVTTAPAAPVPAPTPSLAPAVPPAIATPQPPAPVLPIPAPAPAAAHPPDPDNPEEHRSVPDGVRKKLRAAREEMRSKTAAAEAQAQAARAETARYQGELNTYRAEQGMREDLIRTGVTDMDFAWHELKKHLSSIATDDEKLKAFDIKAWAEEQKKARPFLFNTSIVPANTGVNPSAPAAPAPAAVAGAAGAASVVDSRNLSPEEFQKRMRDRGINVSGSSPPLPRR